MYYFSFIKGNKIAFPNVYGSARVFEVLVWGALFLSYTLGEKIDFFPFSQKYIKKYTEILFL